MYNKQGFLNSQYKQIHQASKANQEQNQTVNCQKQTQYGQQRGQQHQQVYLLQKQLKNSKMGNKNQQKQNEQDEDRCMLPPIVFRTVQNKGGQQNIKKNLKNSQDGKNGKLTKKQNKNIDLCGQLPKIQIKIELQNNVNVYDYQNNSQNWFSEIKSEPQKQNQYQSISQQNKQIVQQQLPIQRPIYEGALQKIQKFDQQSKSPSILFEDTQHTIAFQSKLYYQNYKLILTQPIKSFNSQCKFRIENLKYCVGFGVALKQVIAKHDYSYQSQGSNQLQHGLYLVTSQGYSWSHSQKQQDDIFRSGFNELYNGLTISVKVGGQSINFSCKKGQCTLSLPIKIRNKYTICFCGYLHQKEDSISIG